MVDVVKEKNRFQSNRDSVRRLLDEEWKAIKAKTTEDRKTQLHDHQVEALLKTVDYFNNDSREKKIGLIQIPTGGGKSGIILLLPYALGSDKVMLLSPGKVISNQLESDIIGKGENKINYENSFYCKRGIVKESDADDFITLPYTIRSSIQKQNMSMGNLVIVHAPQFVKLEDGTDGIPLDEKNGNISFKNFEKFDTIIVDEAHHYPAHTWAKVVRNFADRNKKIIFLTATPRPTPKPTDKDLCDEVKEIDEIYTIDRKTLEERKIIRKISREDLTFKLDKKHSDVTAEELNEVASKLKMTLKLHDETVKNVFHKAMVLAQRSKESTQELAKRFNNITDLKLNAAHCTSDMESNNNLRIFNLKTDKIRIMVVCQKLIEGYDNSDVSVCAILRNTESYILFNQFVGRCIRISPEQRNLPGDDVTAILYGGPQKLWDRYENQLPATDDPVDDE